MSALNDMNAIQRERWEEENAALIIEQMEKIAELEKQKAELILALDLFAIDGKEDCESFRKWVKATAAEVVQRCSSADDKETE